MDLGERIAAWDAEAAAFDGPADHGLRDPAVRAAWRRLLADALPPPPAVVADLGCGTGTLSLLLAESGHWVDGIDFSPAMVARAEAKLAGVEPATVALGDAADPDLPSGSYDVVLCRHVLWAVPDPVTTLTRWRDLLVPGGRLVLVEGSWATGAGLTAARTAELVRGAGLTPTVRPLDDPALWGGPTDDERYLVTAEVRTP